MKLRHIIILAIGTFLLSACNMTLAADVTPPPNYVPPTPAPTLGPLYPDQAPDIENGKIIYAEKCVPCHGEKGLGDGPQSADLPVSVIPIGLPEFAHDATPASWYAVVTQGRLERYMPPFNSLNNQERWDVISYALTLHSTKEQVELGKSLVESNCTDCGEAFSNLEMMSALSEDDILKFIREGNGNFPAFGKDFSDDEARAAAAYIRTLTFAVPPAPVAAAPTQTAVNAEAGTPAAEGTPANGTPQAEVMPEATEASASNLRLVKGQVDNQSGQPLPADLKITLRGFDHSSDPSAGPQEVLNQQGDVNPDGSYAFEVELAENQIYLAEVRVDGLNYQSELAIVPADAAELVLAPIIVYPTTEDFNALNVDELQVFFDFAGEEVQIFSVYSITNHSGNTVLVKMSDGQTIPFISFPEGAKGLGFETTDNSAAFVATDDGFAIPPSDTPYGLIAFTSLPKSKEIKVVQPALLPIDTITLYLPEGVQAEGASFSDNGIQQLQSTNFRVYTGAAVAKNDSFEFTLSGAPQTVSESPDITQNQTVLIGIGSFGVVLIIAGVWMFMRDRKKSEEGDEDGGEEDEEIYEDPESIMDAVIALDDLHRAGKISDEAYKKRRAELTDTLKKKG